MPPMSLPQAKMRSPQTSMYALRELAGEVPVSDIAEATGHHGYEAEGAGYGGSIE